MKNLKIMLKTLKNKPTIQNIIQTSMNIQVFLGFPVDLWTCLPINLFVRPAAFRGSTTRGPSSASQHTPHLSTASAQLNKAKSLLFAKYDGFDRKFPNGVGIKCSVIKPAYNPYIIHISSIYKEYP